MYRKNVGKKQVSCDLVCVLVARRAIQGVDDIGHGNVWSQALDADDGVQSQGRARTVGVDASGDGGLARLVGVLPQPEVAVDEEVVHEEDGVGRRGRHIGHDGADAVVSVGVRAQLGAVLHVRVRGTRVASVHEVFVRLGSQRLVNSARQAVVRETRAGSDMAKCVGECLFNH